MYYCIVYTHTFVGRLCVVECLSPIMPSSAASSAALSYSDLQALVIAFGVALFILLLLLVVAIVTAVVLYASELHICTQCMRMCYYIWHF